jgi:hypothetical protein
MKIKVKIPYLEGERRERRLLILAGTELVAQKEPWNDYWEIKEEGCSMCGQCCMTFAPNSQPTPFGADDEGKCNALTKEGDIWVCSAGTKRPYDCLFDPLKENTPECSIVRKKVGK